MTRTEFAIEMKLLNGLWCRIDGFGWRWKRKEDAIAYVGRGHIRAGLYRVVGVPVALTTLSRRKP